ncbi:organic cation/carnitine transporter 7-like protein [Tanacetum coccineum]
MKFSHDPISSIICLETGDQGYDAYTLDEGLSTIGFGKFQVGVLAYAGLGWIAEAMEMMLLSFVGPAIQPEWGLSSSQDSLISTVAFGGMLVGAYSWGVVSDSYGRKDRIRQKSEKLWYIKNLSRVSHARNSVSELGVGMYFHHGFSSLFPLQTEDLGWLFSRLFGQLEQLWKLHLLGGSCLPMVGAWVLLGLSAVPSLVALLCYGLVPESPRYLCTQGRLTEAQYILANGATLNCKDLPKGLLVSDHINESTNEELPGLALAALILDRVGRKISMEIMLVAGFVLLLPLIVHQNAIITTGFLFGARMFISASFIVVCIYAPEVYPTNLRATGVGIATAIGRIGGMVCPLVAVGMGSNCHQTLPVVLFEVIILLSGLTVMLLPFETSGKELSDTLDLPVQHVEVE